MVRIASLISPLSPVSAQSDRETLRSAIEDVPQNMAWTDTREAIELAKEELSNRGRPNAQKAIVLLTDGWPELPEWENNAAARDVYLTELARNDSQ